MAKELVKKEENLPTELMNMEFDFSSVESTDLKIPRILLMQAMSELVNEKGEAKAGDLVNSVTSAIIGSVREKDYKPVKVIPLQMLKTWIVQERVDANTLKYISTIPVTPENSDLEWEFVDEQGRKCKRTKCVSFYVYMESDLGNETALPYMITFRNTSIKGSAAIASHFAECKVAQLGGKLMPPFSRVFEIGGKSEKNDKGTFFVMTSKPTTAVPTQHYGQLFSWYKAIQTPKYKVDDTPDSSKTTYDQDGAF